MMSGQFPFGGIQTSSNPLTILIEAPRNGAPLLFDIFPENGNFGAMKKILLISAALLGIMASAGAQVQSTLDAIPDSLIYALPDYANGSISFSNGKAASGLLNICNIDQKLYFKDKNGTILEVEGSDEVKYASIGGKAFLRYAGMFVMVPNTGETCLAVGKQITIFTDVKSGAYGMLSETSNIKTVNNIYDAAGKIDLTQSITYPYKYKVIPYLYVGGKLMPVTKKNLEKAYPDKKGAVDVFVKENRASLDDYETLSAFIRTLRE